MWLLFCYIDSGVSTEFSYSSDVFGTLIDPCTAKQVVLAHVRWINFGQTFVFCMQHIKFNSFVTIMPSAYMWL